jgi:riboflavin synthase
VNTVFSGIVTDVGRIDSIRTNGDTRFVIATVYDTGGIAIGASICCSGACLTVVETGADWFAVDVSAETLSCTNLGHWKMDTRINLERSLRMGDELGGHMVLGHVDAVTAIVALTREGDSQRLEFSMPPGLARYVAQKGSVALNGVSLTVNDVVEGRFGVNIIPHTQQVTTLGAAQIGDVVNLEVDMIARYLARLMDTA